MLVDVAELEESPQHVAMRVRVEADERRQHDDRAAGLVLPRDVAPARVQQRPHHLKLTVRHRVVQRRVALNARNTQVEMWANAQRDGRPAEYGWRPLFNAVKFG